MIPSKILLWGIGLFGIAAGSFGVSEIVKSANKPKSTLVLTSAYQRCTIVGKESTCKPRNGKKLRQASKGKSPRRQKEQEKVK